MFFHFFFFTNALVQHAYISYLYTHIKSPAERQMYLTRIRKIYLLIFMMTIVSVCLACQMWHVWAVVLSPSPSVGQCKHLSPSQSRYYKNYYNFFFFNLNFKKQKFSSPEMLVGWVWEEWFMRCESNFTVALNGAFYSGEKNLSDVD